MKKQSFIIGAFFLAVGGVLAKVIGAFYKIPLTYILGANGMGVYYLIFPLYSLVLVFTSSGISIAVTKLISSEHRKRNKINQSRILIVASLISFSLAIVCSTLVLIFSKEISIVQGNINAYIGYIAIAPAIICSSIIAILKGYFQGIGNMIPTSMSIVLEQIVKLVVGLILAYKFIYMGIEFAVLGAVLGVTISEVFACLAIVINYLINLKRNNIIWCDATTIRDIKKHIVVCVKRFLKNKKIVKKSFMKSNNKKYYTYDKNILTYRQVFKKVVSYSFPATLSSIIMPITNFIDSFLIINLLISIGFSSIVATSLYGLSTGVVSSLISLPIILISAITTTIIPNISSDVVSDHNYKRVAISEKCSFFIKLTWLIALPLCVAFILYAPEIIQILFSGGLNNRGFSEFEYAYKLLMLSSVSIIYYGFLQTFISILQAINKPEIPSIILFSFLFLRTLLVIFLTSIKEINVFGSIVANIIFLALSSGVCLLYLKKYIVLEFNLKNNLFSPLFAVSISTILGYTIKFLLEDFHIILSTIVSGFGFVICYFLLILLLKVFTTNEKQYFPKIPILKKKIIR